MNILNATGRFYWVVHNNITINRFTALSKIISKKNGKILILGLMPVIPTISAQKAADVSLSNRPASKDDVSGDQRKTDKQYFEEDKTPWERVKAIFEKEFTALSKIISKKNGKILILGLMPVIPTISAQKAADVSLSNRPASKDDVSGDQRKTDKQYFEEDKTPWERVKAIFEKDEFGNYSKEMVATLHCSCMAMFVGVIYGGVQRSRTAFVDFMERNQATLFENHLDAKRRLQNHVTIHFGKGAFYWAWRCSAFTSVFMLIFLSLHTYRGTTRMIDYAISGAVVGAIMRLKFGPPAIVVGGAVGGFLGLLCGISQETLMSLFGTSYDEVLSVQYKLDRVRYKKVEEIAATQLEKSGVMPEPLFEMLKSKENKGEDIK